MAELIATGATPPTLAPFGVERFATGRLIRETSLVVAPSAGDGVVSAPAATGGEAR